MAVTLVRRDSNYQCLSTDEKPDIGEVKIGSEILETDTGRTFRFDGKVWALLASPLPENKEGGTRKVTNSDWDVQELLSGILTELKKIEYHLSIATDTNLKDQDV